MEIVGREVVARDPRCHLRNRPARAGSAAPSHRWARPSGDAAGPGSRPCACAGPAFPARCNGGPARPGHVRRRGQGRPRPCASRLSPARARSGPECPGPGWVGDEAPDGTTRRPGPDPSMQDRSVAPARVCRHSARILSARSLASTRGSARPSSRHGIDLAQVVQTWLPSRIVAARGAWKLSRTGEDESPDTGPRGTRHSRFAEMKPDGSQLTLH